MDVQGANADVGGAGVSSLLLDGTFGSFPRQNCTCWGFYMGLYIIVLVWITVYTMGPSIKYVGNLEGASYFK